MDLLFAFWAFFALLQHMFPVSAVTVTVDIGTTYQEIDGFGFSQAFGRANDVKNLPAAQQKQTLDLLFNTTNGAGMTILRNRVGSGGLGDSIEPNSPGSSNATPMYVWDGDDSGQVRLLTFPAFPLYCFSHLEVLLGLVQPTSQILWRLHLLCRRMERSRLHEDEQQPERRWLFMWRLGRIVLEWRLEAGVCGFSGEVCSGLCLCRHRRHAFGIFERAGLCVSFSLLVWYVRQKGPDELIYSTSYSSMQSNGQQVADFIKVCFTLDRIIRRR